MALTKMTLKPGINREATSYASEGGWYACDRVRFRSGFPEQIGGWNKYSFSTFVGYVRGLYCWNALDTTTYLAVGTSKKYYVDVNGAMSDITPIRKTTSPLPSSTALSLTNMSKLLVVTDNGSAAAVGDYVTISGAAGFAGVDAAEINKEHVVVAADLNTFTVELTVVATSTATGGGAAVDVEYQIWSSLDYVSALYGWGAGAWSRGEWNSATTSGIQQTLRLWSQTAFGEIHFFCLIGGPIYYWSPTVHGIGTRAVALSDVAGGSDVPDMATCILMSAVDRHLLAFGCNPIGSAYQDPLLIRWCDTEDYANWTPDVTNAAGELRIGHGNAILTAVHTGKEILVFTDGGISSLQYIGAPDIYGQQPVSDNISLVSPLAVSTANGSAYWMGVDKFYTYNGRVTAIPCSVQEYVFSDININQYPQIHSCTNEGFNEIWWHYCSSDSILPDRYVIYNYVDGWWSYGSMVRTAATDSSLKRFPIKAGVDYLYYHESGVDDDYNAPMNSYIESADFGIGAGDSLSFVRRILPDVSFERSTIAAPEVTLTLSSRNTTTGSFGDATFDKVTKVSVSQLDDQCHVRLRGRQLKFRLDNNMVGCHWKLGVPRIDMKPDGER